MGCRRDSGYVLARPGFAGRDEVSHRNDTP